MVDVQHSLLTGASLHEPKGVAAAVANRVYVSNGVGGGTWTLVPTEALDITAGAFQNGLCHIREEKPTGGDGDNLDSTIWNKAQLNTKPVDQFGVTLSANQVILPIGTFFVMCNCTGYGFGAGATDYLGIVTRLRNITDATTTLVSPQTTWGYPGPTSNSGGASLNTFFTGKFSITTSKVFEVQRKPANVLNGNYKSGRAAAEGETEVYTDLLIWKVA